MKINDLSPDQLRGAVNLADAYDGWLSAARQSKEGRLRWKESGGAEYLYRLRPGTTTGTSLGPRSKETERLYQEGRILEQSLAGMEKNLLVKGRLYRALRLPMVDPFVIKVLQELDLSNLLGSAIRVIGSTAIPAYELEANALLPSDLLATEDFDMAWVKEKKGKTEIGVNSSLLAALKKADPTWTVIEDRGFKLRNSNGQLIDIVMSPSLVDSYPRQEKVRALPTEGQEYLLGGSPVSHVVTDGRGNTARIVAPDPRLFALHKLYLAEKPDRSLKRSKDISQAEALLTLIEEKMPHYPMDDNFIASLPEDLIKHWKKWLAKNTFQSSPKGPRM